MAEEFLVCGGSWWNSPRNLFSSSPCSLPSNDIGTFGWPTNDVITEMKRSTEESDGSTSVVIQDVQNSVGISMPTESTLPLSSSAATSNAWINHDLLRESARSEDNYSDFLLDSSMNYRPQINKDWNSNSKNFDDHESFGGDDQPAAVNSTSTSTASAECGIPVTSQGSDSYSYASSLLQTLFDADSQPQHSLLHQQTTMSTYSSSSSASSANYQLHSNGFLPSLHPNSNRLWNSTAASFLPSPPSQFLPPSSITNHKPNIHSTRDHKHEQGKDSAAAVNKASNEPPFKRPRMETPSPLPTFKVRKEKLGDRITALQQLVSPFGKTDTASVLHEAIEYIRFLHDQVNALSTPYLKYGSPPVQQRQQGTDKSKDEEGLTKDLKTRGLCLVPISSTFPVAAETTSDFWTPTFGGSSFR